MIIIRYALPPDLIVFSLGNTTYIIEHHGDEPRTPYTITEVGGFKQKTNNINEWLALKTRAKYNLELLHDLADAFIMGRESSYNQEDLENCAETIFKHTREMLFRDGLAGRYVEICDIECMSLDEIRQRSNRALHVAVPQDRVRRFMRVCQKNGWSDLADSWARLLKEPITKSAVVAQVPLVDDIILRSIKRLVATSFTKDKAYMDGIQAVQGRRSLREA